VHSKSIPARLVIMKQGVDHSFHHTNPYSSCWHLFCRWPLRSTCCPCAVQANFYIGVHMSDHIASNHRKNWYIVYSVLLGAILLLALGKEIFNATALRDKRVRTARQSTRILYVSRCKPVVHVRAAHGVTPPRFSVPAGTPGGRGGATKGQEPAERTQRRLHDQRFGVSAANRIAQGSHRWLAIYLQCQNRGLPASRNKDACSSHCLQGVQLPIVGHAVRRDSLQTCLSA
jgi:hypothetical protein